MRYFKANLDELRTALLKFFPRATDTGLFHGDLHIQRWIKKIPVLLMQNKMRDFMMNVLLFSIMVMGLEFYQGMGFIQFWLVLHDF